MEKVEDLFKAFRNKEIEYDELFGSLTQMLSEDPHFSTQAVSALDNAQQLTPIPVTDFIQLRAQVENTAETFHQQEITPGPAESEVTKVFAETAAPSAESTLGSGDPTLMTAPEPTPEAAPPASVSADDYAEEATVIMPMPPRGAPKPTETAPTSSDDDEHATLIATPNEAAIETPAAEPTPVPITTPTPPPEEPAAVSAPDAKATKPALPIPLIGGAAGVLIVLILIVAFWPAGEDSEVTEPVATAAESPWSTPPEPQAPADRVIETEASEPFDQPEAVSVPEAAETLAVDAEPQPTPEESVAEAEPLVKDEPYYMGRIEAAVQEDNLGPAEQTGSATYYLVELIRLNQDSDKISDARALIAKRHLELAKQARENSQWDLAQQHLDDALKVRLPDSYLP